ncbi:MAG TPA: cyclic nucleotide-binding domain-containing protein [Bacteroidota bacterium]|nr:cyclic nucleotide-binding domain-containing protein [Bacteroidota bacterium]
MGMSKSIGESAIWKNIFSERRLREGSIEEILSKVPAFSNLKTRELKEVASIVHRREYRAGEPVFYQGDPGLGMYIIQDGEVSIVISDKDGIQKELAVLTDGDFFGELALLDESPRSAGAICKTDCTLIGFFRPDLFDLIEKKSTLGIKIVLKLAEIVAERLRKTDKELSKLRSQIDRLQSMAKGEGENNGEDQSKESIRHQARKE